MQTAVKLTKARVEREMAQGRKIKMERLPGPPARMPDLDGINKLCPKTQTFSYFFPPHRQAFTVLRDVFMGMYGLWIR